METILFDAEAMQQIGQKMNSIILQMEKLGKTLQCVRSELLMENRTFDTEIQKLYNQYQQNLERLTMCEIQGRQIRQLYERVEEKNKKLITALEEVKGTAREYKASGFVEPVRNSPGFVCPELLQMIHQNQCVMPFNMIHGIPEWLYKAVAEWMQ